MLQFFLKSNKSYINKIQSVIVLLCIALLPESVVASSKTDQVLSYLNSEHNNAKGYSKFSRCDLNYNEILDIKTKLDRYSEIIGNLKRMHNKAANKYHALKYDEDRRQDLEYEYLKIESELKNKIQSYNRLLKVNNDSVERLNKKCSGPFDDRTVVLYCNRNKDSDYCDQFIEDDWSNFIDRIYNAHVLPFKANDGLSEQGSQLRSPAHSKAESEEEYLKRIMESVELSNKYEKEQRIKKEEEIKRAALLEKQELLSESLKAFSIDANDKTIFNEDYISHASESYQELDESLDVFGFLNRSCINISPRLPQLQSAYDLVYFRHREAIKDISEFGTPLIETNREYYDRAVEDVKLTKDYVSRFKNELDKLESLIEERCS